MDDRPKEVSEDAEDESVEGHDGQPEPDRVEALSLLHDDEGGSELLHAVRREPLLVDPATGLSQGLHDRCQELPVVLEPGLWKDPDPDLAQDHHEDHHLLADDFIEQDEHPEEVEEHDHEQDVLFPPQ
jgi:hypothetical protein